MCGSLTQYITVKNKDTTQLFAQGKKNTNVISCLQVFYTLYGTMYSRTRLFSS